MDSGGWPQRTSRRAIGGSTGAACRRGETALAAGPETRAPASESDPQIRGGKPSFKLSVRVEPLFRNLWSGLPHWTVPEILVGATVVIASAMLIRDAMMFLGFVGPPCRHSVAVV